jgi:hypothetical protein
MLGEMVLDAVGAITDDDVVAEIETGDLQVVLVEPGIADTTRALIEEVARAASRELPVIDATDPEAIARLAVDAIHG